MACQLTGRRFVELCALTLKMCIHLFWCQNMNVLKSYKSLYEVPHSIPLTQQVCIIILNFSEKANSIYFKSPINLYLVHQLR